MDFVRFGLFALRHALVLAAIAGTAWAAGRLACRALRLAPPAGAPPAASWALTTAIGLALLAQAALLLGLVGALRGPIVAAGVLGLHIAAAGDWRRAASAMAGAIADAATQELKMWRPPSDASAAADAAAGATSGAHRGARHRAVAAIVASVAVVVFALPSFLLALYPPLGFDETLYHLPFARAFAASGGVPFLPALRFPVFPQLTEVLNAAVLLLAGDVATHLVGWLALAACVALAFGWARELSSPAGGWIAAAMLVGSPLALYLASAGYVEPLLALFGLASLYAADRASRDDDTRGRAAWAIAAGALAGSAAGVKYLGLFFVAAAAVLLIRAKPWREMARDLGGYRLYALYGVAAAAALAPSYARIIAHTGNPLFPFYPEIFGANSWEAQRFVATRGAGRLLAAATLLWDLTFRRHAVGGMPFVSPAFALGVPVALLGAWREPALRRPLLLSIAYVLAVPLQAHYFLGIAPLWSVVIGAAAATLVERTKLERRVAARALVSIAIAFALGGEAYALYRLHRLGMPPADAAGREQLLTAEQPLYSAIAFINRAEGPVTIYGIDAEQMVYYAAGTLLGDHNGPASYALIAARVRARGSVSAALDELGASHLLVPDRPSASFWIEQAAADPRLERIYDDGRATVYRVVPVPRGPVPRLR